MYIFNARVLSILKKFFNDRPMKKEIIQHLTNDFELYSNQTQNGNEIWFAYGLYIQNLSRVGRVKSERR